MNCKKLRLRLDAEPLPEWPAGELASAREHARGCPHCRALLQREEQWVKQWQAAPDPAPPAGFVDSVMARTGAVDRQREMEADRAPEAAGQAGRDGRIWVVLVGLALGLGAYLFQWSSGQFDPGLFSTWLPRPSGSVARELLSPAALAVAVSLALFVSGFSSIMQFDPTDAPGD